MLKWVFHFYFFVIFDIRILYSAFQSQCPNLLQLYIRAKHLKYLFLFFRYIFERNRFVATNVTPKLGRTPKCFIESRLWIERSIWRIVVGEGSWWGWGFSQDWWLGFWSCWNLSLTAVFWIDFSVACFKRV